MTSTLLASLAFIGVPMLCYAAQGATVYLPAGRIGMSLAMLGYCIANVGIIMDTQGI